MNSQESSGGGPLGSLRDLINQKTGNTGTGHSSNLAQGTTTSSVGANDGRGLAASSGNRGTSATVGSPAAGTIGSTGTATDGRDTFGQHGLETTSSTTDPSTTGITSSTHGSYVATGMAGNTSTVDGENNTLGQNSLGSTSNTASINPLTSGIASTVHSSMPSTDMTGNTDTTIGERDTIGRDSGASSGTIGIGTGFSSIENAPSTDTSSTVRDGHASSTVERAEQKFEGGSNAGAGMGIGTGKGLASSYDFLRSQESRQNATEPLDTSGPEHIEPPPGSRDPPVSTSNTSTS